ncbi:nuclear phosphoprotein UL3 homolog [Striga asiatica]|uniref:Nuclear phosphoprotein UL3 homolog n=1 Tax=Striga asiatica TaxID=4170 RepID=A0A5A7NZW1_STRAF|nr:nuclear phosphoprotein UL3 homolog [Striga asiatica]
MVIVRLIPLHANASNMSSSGTWFCKSTSTTIDGTSLCAFCRPQLIPIVPSVSTIILPITVKKIAAKCRHFMNSTPIGTLGSVVFLLFMNSTPIGTLGSVVFLLPLHDLHREHAPARRRVFSHDSPEPSELALLLVLKLCLEIHVERVRHVLPPVEPAARPSRVHARAVPSTARDPILCFDSFVVLQRRVQHAPPLGHPINPAGPDREHVSTLAR